MKTSPAPFSWAVLTARPPARSCTNNHKLRHSRQSIPFSLPPNYILKELLPFKRRGRHFAPSTTLSSHRLLLGLKYMQQRLKRRDPLCCTSVLSVLTTFEESNEQLKNSTLASAINPEIRPFSNDTSSPFVLKSEIEDLTGRVEKSHNSPIGWGGQATVYVGQLRRSNSDSETVAIKVIRLPNPNSGSPRPNKEKLLREAVIWINLNHPNITPFFGICYAPDWPGAPCFITPYYANGNVAVFLKRHPHSDRFQLVCEVAAGVSYLHRSDILIVHGDIKATNILVNDQGQACLSDFGCALALERSGFTSVYGGTGRYMAPELITDDNLRASLASDVWAFALTVTEIFSGRLPFFEFWRDEVVLYKVANGALPRRQDYCKFHEINDNVWWILVKCWALDPAERPPMQDLFVQFDSIAVARRTSNPHTVVLSDGYSQSSGHGKPTFLSKLHVVLDRLNICSRRRAVSFSEGSIDTSKSNAEPCLCQWGDGLTSLEYQPHELHESESTHDGSYPCDQPSPKT